MKKDSIKFGFWLLVLVANIYNIHSILQSDAVLNFFQEKMEAYSNQEIPPIRYSGGNQAQTFFSKEMVVSALEQAPASLRAEIKQVTISRAASSENDNMKKTYNDQRTDIGASMDSVTGKMTIFPYPKEDSTVEQLVGVFAHEAAHPIDRKIGALKPVVKKEKDKQVESRGYQANTGELFSDQTEWNQAMRADDDYNLKVFGEVFMVSSYAEDSKRVLGTNREDFAESMRVIIQKPGYFHEHFPNREKILRSLIPDLSNNQTAWIFQSSSFFASKSFTLNLSFSR